MSSRPGRPGVRASGQVEDRNEVTRVIGLGDGFGANDAILAADSLWIPDEAGRRVIRIELADLR